MWRRYVVGNPLFIMHIVKEMIQGNNKQQEEQEK